MAAIQAHRRAISSTSIYDADTLAYFSAAGMNIAATYYAGTAWQITGTALWAAVDTLVKALKANGLWNALVAFHPRLGGTAQAVATSLKSPGTYTYIFNGITDFTRPWLPFTGSQWVRTSVLVGNLPTGQGYALDYYSLDNIINNSAVDIGMSVAGNAFYMALSYGATAGAETGQGSSGALYAPSTVDTRGLFTIDRDVSNVSRLYRNGGQLSTRTETGGVPNNATEPIFVGAASIGGPAYYTNRRCALDVIRGSYTLTQTATYYNIIQTFQTALNRNV